MFAPRTHRRRGARRPGWTVGALAAPGLAAPVAAHAGATAPPQLAAAGINWLIQLDWAIFWMALGVFVLVQGLLLVAAFRFRRHTAGQPDDSRGTTHMDAIWVVGPALMMAVIFFLTFQSLLAR